MALEPPPPGMDAEIDLGGVRAQVGEEVRITEWEIRIDDEATALTALEGVRVASDARVPDRYSLVLKTREQTLLVGTGYPVQYLVWLADALREAERTRARREGIAGREYLFERVVPDEVQALLSER